MDIRRAIYWLPVVLSVVALPLALTALYLSITNGERVVYEQGALDSQEAADIAARALQQAEQNNETAATVLSLLEGGSVLLTLIVGAVAAIYTLNLRDLRQDLESKADASQEKVENALALREAELENLALELRNLAKESQKQIEQMTSAIGERLESARQHAEAAFQVLSLQLMAEQQVRARNYEMAVTMLREAHQMEPDNQSTNYLLGYLYIAQRKFKEALSYLEKTFKLAPNFAPALAAMGLAQRRLGDQETDPERRNRYWAEAEVNLIKALEMDSGMLDGDGESYYGTLGGLYRRQNRYDDAIRAYERAVNITPNSSYPVGNLAVLYKIHGRDQEAAQMFARTQKIVEAIIEDRPGDYWARFDLAQALLVQGKTDQAFMQYDEIAARKPPVTALRTALSTLEALVNTPQPIPRIQDALDLLQTLIGQSKEEEAA